MNTFSKLSTKQTCHVSFAMISIDSEEHYLQCTKLNAFDVMKDFQQKVKYEHQFGTITEQVIFINFWEEVQDLKQQELDSRIIQCEVCAT